MSATTELKEGYWYSQLARAKQIATDAHKGQTRWDKKTPYITHPEAVAENFKGGCYQLQMVAWLHDVIEDTSVTANDLYKANIPHSVILAVQAITKREGEEYSDYIKRVAKNEFATKVKIADIKHNLSCGLKKGSMRDKYLIAIEYLELRQALRQISALNNNKEENK